MSLGLKDGELAVAAEIRRGEIVERMLLERWRRK